MDYTVLVNDKYRFDLPVDKAEAADAIAAEDGRLHVLHDHKSYTAEIIHEDFLNRRYEVKVNNVTYSVAIQGELDLLIKQMGFETGANKLVNTINAPMPGLILEISVSVGQSVAKNDPMLILSAMKMENSFVSPRDGIIKAIHANVGDAVEKGQLLIEFE
ncbi:MAG TPA: acetyl-CoA carboxylase biotin carboxyl carrier protein subunit [Flavobacterium sp.]|jgi:biotin carboxyl carrier protein